MIVDILVGAVLVISAIIAFLRGFIRETLTILGVVGGAAASYFGGPHLIPHMNDWLGVEENVEPERLFGILPHSLIADVLAYGSIFIVVVIVLSIISHILAETAKSIGLGAIDRTLGVIFGLVRGAILLGLFYLPFHMLLDDETKENWFESSRTHFYLEQTAEIIAGFLPESTEDDLEQQVEELTEQGESTRKKLEQIDLLKKEAEKRGLSEEDLEKLENKGYNEDFRQKMDELFEQQTDENNEQQLHKER